MPKDNSSKIIFNSFDCGNSHLFKRISAIKWQKVYTLAFLCAVTFDTTLPRVPSLSPSMYVGHCLPLWDFLIKWLQMKWTNYCMNWWQVWEPTISSMWKTFWYRSNCISIVVPNRKRRSFFLTFWRIWDPNWLKAIATNYSILFNI